MTDAGGATAAAGLPRAHGAGVLQAFMRRSPADFIVEEIDAFTPSGQGEHLLLTVRKTAMNTAHAARTIAAWAGVAESAIGYAGLKDRHAVTTQRFSVWLPKKTAPPLDSLQTEQLQVMQAHWHARKLPRGALAGNRFAIVLRDVQGEHNAIEMRLRAIADLGIPNYFGEQRFGRDGGNIEKALAMFAGKRMKREERGLLLSAARSRLFNHVLVARVQAGEWNTAVEGDVFMLDGSRSVFGPVPVDAEIQRRIAEFDIHPSGVLWGRGALRTQSQARAYEEMAMQDTQSLALRVGLERAGLDQERRALRVRPRAMQWNWLDADSLRITLELPAGAYATAVLSELGEVQSAAPRGGESIEE